ncbi:Mpo1 family 2-hydroxy fatty acid dioxygenase [Pontibacter pudoricolor]|uniref:Mpo1 family 2-hydroxy fatty acid dioxygenase n=1 Tax=Pontibacter pudoricolor TaxID=2694930 RepID=UPI0013914F85|nr:Mpo1-like protein [Pontibacter pudoricolor]
MKPIQQWFDEYGQSHQNHTNKLIHWICVPLIFFSIIGLLASLPSEPLKMLFPEQLRPFVHFGTIVILLGLLFYLRLSVPMFVGMAIVCAVMLWLVYLVDYKTDSPLWLVSLIVFVVAWVGQFYGHKVEGKKPSFLKDLQFLLIGPAWLLGFIYRKLGIPY